MSILWQVMDNNGHMFVFKLVHPTRAAFAYPYGFKYRLLQDGRIVFNIMPGHIGHEIDMIWNHDTDIEVAQPVNVPAFNPPPPSAPDSSMDRPRDVPQRQYPPQNREADTHAWVIQQEIQGIKQDLFVTIGERDRAASQLRRDIDSDRSSLDHEFVRDQQEKVDDLDKKISDLQQRLNNLR